MRVCFCASDKPRERLLSDAFLGGVRAHGDEGFMRPLSADKSPVECEVAVMVGVKSRELFQSYWSAGTHVVYLDKGYARGASEGPVKVWEYWRLAVDAHQPTGYLMDVKRPSDRWDRLELDIKPWKKRGETVVFAGSSAKYHDFYGLKDPTTYAQQMLKRLHSLTNRDLVYRPKPSWRDATPIGGAAYSIGSETIYTVLERAHVLITHGSNATFEAMLMGVPSIVLGDAVAKPISSTTIEDVEKPLRAPDEERAQLLHNLAYCQWTQTELLSGEAWGHIRPQILR